MLSRTSRRGISIYHASETKYRDFKVLRQDGEKGGLAELQYLLRFCNKKRDALKKTDLNNSDYRGLIKTQQFATKCFKSATNQGLTPITKGSVIFQLYYGHSPANAAASRGEVARFVPSDVAILQT